MRIRIDAFTWELDKENLVIRFEIHTTKNNRIAFEKNYPFDIFKSFSERIFEDARLMILEELNKEATNGKP